MAYTRGVLTTGTSAYGYVQSIDHTHEADFVDVRTESGITKVHDAYDKRSKVEVTAKFDRANTLPTIGGNVTLAATPSSSLVGVYQVDNVQVSEVNTDAATAKISLVRFIDGAIPTT